MVDDILTDVVGSIVMARKRRILSGGHRSDIDKEYFSKAAILFLDGLISGKEDLREDIVVVAEQVLSE